MSTYYIQLSASDHDRINLTESDVDLVNYDNNRFNVYGIVFCDDDNRVFDELYFSNREERDEYLSDNGFEAVYLDWIYNMSTWSITEDHGTWFESIPCTCDAQVAFVRA